MAPLVIGSGAAATSLRLPTRAGSGPVFVETPAASLVRQERDTLVGLFLNSAGDITRNPGAATATAEDFGMTYWFDRSMRAGTRDTLARRLAFWCDATKAQQSGMPVPYNINYTNQSVGETNNSQHAFWGAKLFLEHYAFTGETAWLNRAVEIADWVIGNMIVGTTPNRRFLRRTDQNWASIKTVSSADSLVRIGALTGDAAYAAVFNEHLDWLKANARIDGADHFNENIDSDTLAADNVDRWHCNLEMADGLLDAYAWGGDPEHYALAQAVYETVTAVEPANHSDTFRDPMTAFQTAYIGQRLGLTSGTEAANADGLSMRNEDGGFPANGRTGTSNIFSHTYRMAWLHYSVDPELTPPA